MTAAGGEARSIGEGAAALPLGGGGCGGCTGDNGDARGGASPSSVVGCSVEK